MENKKLNIKNKNDEKHKKANTYIKFYNSDLYNYFFKFVNILGSYKFYIIILFGFLFVNKIYEFYFLSLGFIILYVIASPLRLIFFNERPIPIKYTNIVEKINASSFPSLHSARSIFLFLFLYYIIEKNYISLVWLIITIGIIYARIHFKKHYLQDVIAGVFLAVIVFIVVEIIFK